jgi:hypothetical protein
VFSPAEDFLLGCFAAATDLPLAHSVPICKLIPSFALLHLLMLRCVASVGDPGPGHDHRASALGWDSVPRSCCAPGPVGLRVPKGRVSSPFSQTQSKGAGADLYCSVLLEPDFLCASDLRFPLAHQAFRCLASEFLLFVCPATVAAQSHEHVVRFKPFRSVFVSISFVWNGCR